MNDTAKTYPPLFASPSRVPQNGTWEGQIPTDQLWRYLYEIEIAHCHDSMVDTDAWGKLLWISESPHQGWDVWLGCDRECKLQSCFGETTYGVRAATERCIGRRRQMGERRTVQCPNGAQVPSRYCSVCERD